MECLYNDESGFLLKATKRRLPIIVDAERKREQLEEILTFADYLVTSAKFPQVEKSQLSRPLGAHPRNRLHISMDFTFSQSWISSFSQTFPWISYFHNPFGWQIWTEEATLAEAVIHLAVLLPRLKFIIVTQGAKGCIMLEMSSSGDHSFTGFLPFNIGKSDVVSNDLRLKSWSGA